MTARFWAKVDKAGDCWNWTASRDRAGYGTFGFQGKVQKAHRVSYLITHGAIPDGAHILHSCDNPPCVNPDHLRAGTRSDNMRDKVTRGRDHNASKTHCDSGHALDDANTYITPDGRRNCRSCRAIARRAYLARSRATNKAA